MRRALRVPLPAPGGPMRDILVVVIDPRITARMKRLTKDEDDGELKGHGCRSAFLVPGVDWSLLQREVMRPL